LTPAARKFVEKSVDWTSLLFLLRISRGVICDVFAANSKEVMLNSRATL
jgi:hypothetical protein